MKIDLDKIVTQAVTAVVVLVFVGACTVVWRGATSVDDKVKATESKLEAVIKQLSDRLAGYEVQISGISNQLVTLVNQTAALPSAPNVPQFYPYPGATFTPSGSNSNFNLYAPTKSYTIGVPPKTDYSVDVQQRARGRDIYEQFKQAK
jgi:hypothetical protein